MNQMPQMPGLPKPQESQLQSSGEAQAPQAPFTEGPADNSAGSDVELNTPSHDSAPAEPFIDPVSASAPSIEVSKPSPANEVKAPVAPKSGIKVVATRKGFYNQMRYNEGDNFVIRSEEEFGEWMRCLDAFWEKKRVEHFMNKKQKAK